MKTIWVHGLLFSFLIAVLATSNIGTARAQSVEEYDGHGDSSDSTGTQSDGGGPNFGPGGGPNVGVHLAPPHPGPPYVTGAADPCAPFGPSGYDWRDNAVGIPLPPGCVRPKGWGSNTQINAPQQNTKTKGKAGANDIKFQAAKPTLDPGLPGTEWGPNSTKIDANHIRITSPKTGTQYDLATTRTIEVPGPEMHDKPLLELGKLQRFAFSQARPEYAWGVYKGPSGVSVNEPGTTSNK